MINNERLINTFIDYVKIDSESGNEKSISKQLLSDLEKIGLVVETDQAGDKCNSNANNIYGFLEGSVNAEPILFSAHMDTVKPGKNIKPIIDKGFIRSNSNTILGSDDKSGLAVIVEALRIISENNYPHRPIEVIFTICEEIGLKGSLNLDYHRIRSRKAVLMDSSGTAGHIKIKAPGKCKLNFNVIGKKAHAGASPEVGISSIMVAAEAISRMNLLRIDKDTTANIGSFIANGPTNTVCDQAEIVAECRSFSLDLLEKQIKHMVNCFMTSSKKFGAKVDYDVEILYYPYALDENCELVQLAKKACKVEGIPFFTFGDGGGSDANNYMKNGIDCIALGNGMDFVHTVDEELNIIDFINAVRVVLNIMKI